MIRKTHHTPVYREVIREALAAAWHDKRLWILAFLASALTTAGVYDVLWSAVTNISNQGSRLAASFGGIVIQATTVRDGTTLTQILRVIANIEVLLVIALLVLVVGALSCIGQGGLVYAIGARKRGRKPTLTESFSVGAKALWPVIALNVLALGTIWLLKFLGSLPLYFAIENPSSATYFAHIGSFIVSLLLMFIVIIVEIFALNALILQGAHLEDALKRGWDLFRKNWIVVVETAILQLFLASVIWFLFTVAFTMALLPIFIFLVTALTIDSAGFLAASGALGLLLFVGGFFTLAAFTIHFQFATWTLLFRRLGEGGVVPKLHRMLRSATGSTSIKQS